MASDDEVIINLEEVRIASQLLLLLLIVVIGHGQ